MSQKNSVDIVEGTEQDNKYNELVRQKANYRTIKSR